MTQAFVSPNFGPRHQRADMIVLHYTGMKSAEAALERLCDPQAQVSAHYLIDEDGRLFDLVDPRWRAWHAGLASWEGDVDVNSRSIGIELVNPGHEFGYQAFPDKQLATLLALLGRLCGRYHIPRYAIWGHSDVAPTRKEDPGEKFPWAWLAKHGFGLWPSVFDFQSSRLDAAELLDAIGYETQPLEPAKLAFKRHFRPRHLHQGWTKADTATAASVLAALERVRLGRRA